MDRPATADAASTEFPSGSTAASSGASIRIGLLGEFHLSIADGGGSLVEPTAWRLAKAQGLVKFLALAPRYRVEREYAQEQLWSDLAPAAAANNFHQALHVARRVLSSANPRFPVLRLTRGLLVLAPADQLSVDVVRFEAAAARATESDDPSALQGAIDLYGGDLLPGEPELWLVARRESLRQAYLNLLLSLARVQHGRRELDGAIATLRRAVDADPTFEEAHTALMTLYAETGRRQQALAQFRQLEAALSRELDIEPGPRSRAIYDAVWSGSDPPPPSVAGVDAKILMKSARPGLVVSDHDLVSPHRAMAPAASTSFIGRTEALRDLDRVVAHHSVVTIVGGGGSGKTRLALEWARRRSCDDPADIYLVELAPIVDGSLAPSAIARAVGLPLQNGQSPRQTLVHVLRDRRLVLILDNCEHIAQACAELVPVLLAECPHLRLLMTSRQPLGLPGEAIWTIPPFDIPSLAPAPNLDELSRVESVQLFLARVQHANPGFALSTRNMAAVADICRRFGELPLAVELIASRTRTLPATELAGHLDHGLDLLAGDNKIPGRHDSIRSTLDWSYGLLTRSERALFRRLSVFRGSCPLDAIEAVCNGGSVSAGSTLRVFMQLVDKSLVHIDESNGAPRYRLLEPVRQYAERRTRSSSESESLSRRHAEFYAALSERAEEALHGPEQSAWLERLDSELDNARAAIDWCVRTEDATELGLRLASGLWRFWQVHNHHAEARRSLTALLARRGNVSPDVLARALNAAGNLARDQSDFEYAVDCFEESLGLHRELGNHLGAAHALNNLGLVARETGDLDRAQTLGEESLTRYRDAHSRFGEGLALLNLGQAARWRGDLDRAAARYEESLHIFQEVDDRWHIASLLSLLAWAVYEQGDLAAARAYASESLTLHRSTGDAWGTGVALSILGKAALSDGDHSQAVLLLGDALRALQAANARRTIPDVLVDVARLLAAADRHEDAARLLGAAVALRDAVGALPPPDELAIVDTMIAEVRAALDADAWTLAWTAGTIVRAEVAVESAIAATGDWTNVDAMDPPSATASPASRLTPRELDIAALVAKGRTNREIARELSISERTVETHIRRMLGKLGGVTRADIAAWMDHREASPSRASSHGR